MEISLASRSLWSAARYPKPLRSISGAISLTKLIFLQSEQGEFDYLFTTMLLFWKQKCPLVIVFARKILNGNLVWGRKSLFICFIWIWRKLSLILRWSHFRIEILSEARKKNNNKKKEQKKLALYGRNNKVVLIRGGGACKRDFAVGFRMLYKYILCCHVILQNRNV